MQAGESLEFLQSSTNIGLHCPDRASFVRDLIWYLSLIVRLIVGATYDSAELSIANAINVVARPHENALTLGGLAVARPHENALTLGGLAQSSRNFIPNFLPSNIFLKMD